MIKFRTMVPDAWKSGVNSTADGDCRITRVGRWLRRVKLDELPQLWNVLMGEMSLVGPRPQVRADVSLYTPEENEMLAARPGITDLASVVFSDEGRVLAGSADPDLLYNQVIRPWKSRLILLYLKNQSLSRDMKIVGITALSIVSRKRALRAVALLVDSLGGDEKLRTVVRREQALEPWPPPGAQAVVERYRPASHCGEATVHA
jgi:lipopolysaccharide/colanic/teichoic acid biosynthesis glycosyltransferase